jgi:hypothetical protein
LQKIGRNCEYFWTSERVGGSANLIQIWIIIYMRKTVWRVLSMHETG